MPSSVSRICCPPWIHPLTLSSTATRTKSFAAFSSSSSVQSPTSANTPSRWQTQDGPVITRCNWTEPKPQWSIFQRRRTRESWAIPIALTPRLATTWRSAQSLTKRASICRQMTSIRRQMSSRQMPKKSLKNCQIHYDYFNCTTCTLWPVMLSVIYSYV